MQLTQEIRLSAKRLLKLALVDGKINEERVLAIVDDILANKPRHYIAILERFVALLKLEVQRQTLTVSSAKEVGKDEMDRILDTLNKVFHGVSYVRSEVDAALIGGLKVKVGSDVWDDSVQGRLRKVERELSV